MGIITQKPIVPVRLKIEDLRSARIWAESKGQFAILQDLPFNTIIRIGRSDRLTPKESIAYNPNERKIFLYDPREQNQLSREHLKMVIKRDENHFYAQIEEIGRNPQIHIEGNRRVQPEKIYETCLFEMDRKYRFELII